ncbi:hypothetical protein [Halomonas sp. N3-2A]|uniref:hypothetical protein n=1 Tax=Halomonas sp. N3-2A TaxID=2014541 RepID=UPI000B5B0E9B|nr:hypothetical protein [Halomonas sp. N3-2A]ASK18397.1 hypothetical protein CEK60_03330 [Halomonas sp. N3-2A]
MQHIHHCNGEGLPNYPDGVTPKDVNVWIHDSLMVATHDYSCPVCRTNSAVLWLHNGMMQPCDECRSKGYELVKRDIRSWWRRILN